MAKSFSQAIVLAVDGTQSGASIPPIKLTVIFAETRHAVCSTLVKRFQDMIDA